MSGANAAASSDRLPGVDVLRAAAALLVLVCHVMDISNWEAGGLALAIGQMGRRLFLVLSGFLLFLPYARAAYGRGRRVGMAEYALKRALRLLPLYVTAVLAFALLGFVRGWPANGKNLLYHLLFIHTYDKSTFFGLAGPLWFIAVIAHWYVLLPFVGWVWLKLKHRLVVWAAATFVLVAAHALVWARPPLAPDAFRRIVDKGFLGALPFFFAAMTAAAYFVRARWRAGFAARPLPIAWASASALLLIGVLVMLRWQVGHHLSPLILSAVVVGFGFSSAGGSLLAPVRSFGRMSYSVFMWHTPVLIGLSWLNIFWRIESGPLRMTLMFVAALPPVLLASYVSYRLLERPFIGLRIAVPQRALVRIAAGYTCVVLASAVLFASGKPRSSGTPEPVAEKHAEAHRAPGSSYSGASR